MAGLHTDDFGDAFQFGVRVVFLIPVDHENHIGFLLDNTGLAEVSCDRALISTFFDLTVKLSQCDDRATQLFRQVFQAGGDLPYAAVHVLRVRHAHLLEVINNDHTKSTQFLAHSPGFRSHLMNAEGWLVVDIDRGFDEILHAVADLSPGTIHHAALLAE
ncbi:Uncharacterised protein [Enterobacter hormaechei]|nr:Uncharacterised protein [Enterobacter hormaechei]